MVFHIYGLIFRGTGTFHYMRELNLDTQNKITVKENSQYDNGPSVVCHEYLNQRFLSSKRLTNNTQDTIKYAYINPIPTQEK